MRSGYFAIGWKNKIIEYGSSGGLWTGSSSNDEASYRMYYSDHDINPAYDGIDNQPAFTLQWLSFSLTQIKDTDCMLLSLLF